MFSVFGRVIVRSIYKDVKEMSQLKKSIFLTDGWVYKLVLYAVLPFFNVHEMTQYLTELRRTG